MRSGTSRNKRHGHMTVQGASPTYQSWSCMRNRCNNPKYHDYVTYSKLGYCPSWDVFENFLSDMGLRPKNTTLDRIDGTRGYSKDNCRWATKKEQAVNRSTTLWITYRGEQLTLTDACNRAGLNRSTVTNRRYRNGETPQEAFDYFLEK